MYDGWRVDRTADGLRYATHGNSPWWMCPNDPGCSHPGLIHDVYDFEDTRPRCCADGCDCGRAEHNA